MKSFEKIIEKSNIIENFKPYVETFVSKNNLQSEPTEAFENDLHSQNDTAVEELFICENFQAPDETYASHVGGSFLLYILLIMMAYSLYISRNLIGD